MSKNIDWFEEIEIQVQELSQAQLNFNQRGAKKY